VSITRFLDSSDCIKRSLSPFHFDLGVDPLPSVDPNFRHFSEFLKYFLFFRSNDLVVMPRRPPPTPLLLVQGPLPRGRFKFTMPSVPRPIFHPETADTHRPATRQRVYSSPAVSPGGLGWRAGRQGSSSPCAIRGAHVRPNTAPVDVGRVVMPARAAMWTG